MHQIMTKKNKRFDGCRPRRMQSNDVFPAVGPILQQSLLLPWFSTCALLQTFSSIITNIPKADHPQLLRNLKQGDYFYKAAIIFL